MTLRQQAKEIAQLMNSKGLYPWHVLDEIKKHDVPKPYKKELTQMIVEELNKLQEN